SILLRNMLDEFGPQFDCQRYGIGRPDKLYRKYRTSLTRSGTMASLTFEVNSSATVIIEKSKSCGGEVGTPKTADDSMFECE
ncbi:hypothetical protein Dimus_001781, partial [Dionaea muscipula]